ncbi:MAG: ankyrin repeat domain-containing protein [Planctomycetota bacterium]
MDSAGWKNGANPRRGWPGSPARRGVAPAMVLALALAAAAVGGAASRLQAADVLAAAQSGDTAALQAALTTDKTCVEQANPAGDTVLILTARNGSVEALKAVLAAKPAVNRTNRDSETALYTAVTNKHTDAAKLLRAAGARVDCMSVAGLTPLMVALKNDDLTLATWLIDEGANVNYLSREIDRHTDGPRGILIRSCLHLAVSSGDAKLVTLLLEHHADPEVQEIRASPEEQETGKTALHAAVEKDNRAMVQTLLDHGALIDSRDDHGATPLMLAARSGDLDLIMMLLDRKADVTLTDQMQQSALDYVDGSAAKAAEISAEFAKRGLKPNTGRLAILALRELATAQAQYNKKTDYYSASGQALNQAGTLIASDMAGAFEAYLGNGDGATPKAYHGYVFRMLQGDGVDGKTNFYKQDGAPDQGMNTWGCIARPVNGQGKQYFISEQGTVYEKADPGTGKFLLECCIPNADLGEGNGLAVGWKVATTSSANTNDGP